MVDEFQAIRYILTDVICWSICACLLVRNIPEGLAGVLQEEVWFVLLVSNRGSLDGYLLSSPPYQEKS